MPYIEFIWNEEPDGNVDHIAEHGISIEDVEEVLFNPVDRDVCRSSGYPMVFGYALDGRYIAVVYEQVDHTTIYPITAFEVGE